MNKETIKKPFWALDRKKTLKTLESSLKNGLTDASVQKRLQTFGKNTLKDEGGISKIALLLRQFKSPLIFILLIAGIVTLFLEVWIDAIVIFLAIIVNTLLGFYQENKAENSLEILKTYIQERARVIRDGREQEIDAKNIVPGDVIYIAYGTRIPADARLLSVQDFSVDEAILTGESLPISKNTKLMSSDATVTDKKNMVFGGTLGVSGYATAVVTGTGKNTEIGRIAELVSATKREKTPLQKAIWKLAWIIAGLIAFLVLGIFLLGVIRGEDLFQMFLVSVAIAVGAIPEALPVSLTAILAVGVVQLAKKKGVMRNLGAAETLGSTTVIITDKTGTLTQAKMQLVDILDIDDLIKNSKKKQSETLSSKIDEAHKSILKLAVLNTDAVIENPQDDYKDWRMTGNPLDINIVKASANLGIDINKLEKEENFQLILPFNSKNKFSVSLVEPSKTFCHPLVKNKRFLMVLGAPDILLSKSDLPKNEYNKLLNSINKISDDGRRVLAVAVKPITKHAKNVRKIKPEKLNNLSFLGLLLFYDPVREEVPEAIKKMESFGVKIVMATGDLKGTAVSLGRDLGWEINENEVLTGEDLAKLSDEELLKILYQIKVFARMSPEDKLRIGQLYQQKNEIVGMTGDGVNDAPSLKAVNIGIAVGSGSDVAKDVADLVLLNDNFQTIVSAIEEGKRMLVNIRKSFVYLMANCLDGVFLIGGSLLVGLAMPLTALQVLWVNFLTGSLPAISFAFDQDFDSKKRISKTKEKILNNEVKFLTIILGTLNSLLLLLLYMFLARTSLDEELVKTFIFTCLASYVLILAFALRSLKRPIFTYNIFSNKFLTIGVLIGVLFLVATIYVPFLQEVFNTVNLPLLWWGWAGLWSILNVFLVEITKWLFRKS